MDSGEKLIEKALAFATKHHEGQFRKGSAKRPYIVHPTEVAMLLINRGGVQDAEVLAAALLHDTVENTPATFEQIEKKFGKRVRILVEEVSDDKTLSPSDRKQLQIFTASVLSHEAKQIKLADKISNVSEVNVSGWSIERLLAYIAFCEKVVNEIRGCNPALEKLFGEKVAEVLDNLSLEHQATQLEGSSACVPKICALDLL